MTSERVGASARTSSCLRILLLPAGIGMMPPLVRDGALVARARCSYDVRTRAPTGIVEVVPGRGVTIGDLFRVWGQPLARDRIAGFRGRVRAYVAGSRRRGGVRAIPLRRYAQIALEVAGYVPPHRFFLFRADSVKRSLALLVSPLAVPPARRPHMSPPRRSTLPARLVDSLLHRSPENRLDDAPRCDADDVFRPLAVVEHEVPETNRRART